MKEIIREIIEEVEATLDKVDFSNVEVFLRQITSAQIIVTYGAGRVGLAMRAFTKRLTHLGLRSYFLEDSSIPALGPKDLFVVASGSGTTPTVLAPAQVAVSKGIPVIGLTSREISPLVDLSSALIVIPSPTKLDIGNGNMKSRQPMTTLFEQSLGLLLDSLVIRLMVDLNESHESMVLRHNVIE